MSTVWSLTCEGFGGCCCWCGFCVTAESGFLGLEVVGVSAAQEGARAVQDVMREDWRFHEGLTAEDRVAIDSLNVGYLVAELAKARRSLKLARRAWRWLSEELSPGG